MTRTSTASEHPRSHEGAIDYLIIGHVTVDLTPGGPRLGGTASYASLTASALGLRVGLVTACDSELDLTPLAAVAVQRRSASRTTTFRNVSTRERREQFLIARSESLILDDVPPGWRSAPIVHLAPVADELSPQLASDFEGAFVGITPQGWWRVWDEAGRVDLLTVEEALARLPSAADAAVFSRDDLSPAAEELGGVLQAYPAVAITHGARGADVFWDAEKHHVPALATQLLDDTGAGDVFAAVFFIQLASGRPPAEAAAEATGWASASVAHAGPDWIRSADRTAFRARANP